MRKFIFLPILICSCLTLVQAQLPQWTAGNGLTTDATVGIGTTTLSARLHIADGFGGEQLRITRGTGSVRFTQSFNKDNLYLYNNDATKLYTIWQDNGNVGIGTDVPSEKLTVNGNLLLTGAPKVQFGNRFMMQVPIALENYYTRSIVSQNIVWNESTSKWSIPDQMYTDFSMLRFENGGRIGFFNRAVSSGAEMTDSEMEAYRRLTIEPNGNVGIGTTNPGSYRLAVEGTIGARKVKVTLDDWVDYVFYPTYRLRPLSEVEKYIQQHHHLPEVPSAEEVEKEGLDVGENQAALLKKIEEITLYLIEQNKRIEKLEAANAQLRQEIKLKNQ